MNLDLTMQKHLEKLIDDICPLRFPGKGRLLTQLVPTEGERDILLFNQFRVKLNLANVQQRQMFMRIYYNHKSETLPRLYTTFRQSN